MIRTRISRLILCFLLFFSIQSLAQTHYSGSTGYKMNQWNFEMVGQIEMNGSQGSYQVSQRSNGGGGNGLAVSGLLKNLSYCSLNGIIQVTGIWTSGGYQGQIRFDINENDLSFNGTFTMGTGQGLPAAGNWWGQLQGGSNSGSGGGGLPMCPGGGGNGGGGNGGGGWNGGGGNGGGGNGGGNGCGGTPGDECECDDGSSGGGNGLPMCNDQGQSDGLLDTPFMSYYGVDGGSATRARVVFKGQTGTYYVGQYQGQLTNLRWRQDNWGRTICEGNWAFNGQYGQMRFVFENGGFQGRWWKSNGQQGFWNSNFQ